jgi:hypothetical protein
LTTQIVGLSITSVKINGAKEKVRHLYIKGKLNGIISIGGMDFYISDLDIVFVDELKKKRCLP